MGKVIKFPTQRQVPPNVKKLKDISDKIDEILVAGLTDNDIDPHELAGILAHRLGTLMRNMDEKSKLWVVCEQVLKRQASLD